jgi:diguanylate cyclase (GGDEF)-like protein
VLRFAILSAVCLGVAAAGILGVTRHLNVQAAQQNVATQVSFASSSVLADAFTQADLQAAPDEVRRRELDRILARRLSALNGIVLVSLSGTDGRVTYSTNHGLIGTKIGPAGRVADAARVEDRIGHVISVEGRTEDVVKAGTTLKTLDVYAPLFPRDGGRGIVRVSIDHEVVVVAAMQWFYPVAGILEGTLVLLYLLLLPVLARVSRRLREQVTRIHYQAYHDDLTDLPNRLQFRESTDAALEAGSEETVAVMIIDLDRFKEVNDTLGHHAGDDLLRELAQSLRKQAPDGVLVARLGGDEFGVLATVTPERDAAHVAESIRAILNANFTVQGIPLGVEASIGIAVAPEHGQDVDTLMQRADLAMYDAKSRLAGIAFYDDDLDRSSGAEIGLLAELRRALDERELLLHYQPKVSLTTNEIVGVEALVRWQHPSRGLLYPNQFLTYAEHTGLNRSLTRYVLNEALQQKQRWHTEGIDLPVAVNITMYDLLDPGFPAEVRGLLDAIAVDPSDLELEITESSIMSDTGRVREALHALHDLGIQLAIDDFGSGYSSLSYLIELEIDTLKIDKSFILGMSRGVKPTSVIKTIIELGHVLNLEVAAEGVETIEDWNTLQSNGCDIAQGFLISKPIPPDELLLLHRHNTAPQILLHA